MRVARASSRSGIPAGRTPGRARPRPPRPAGPVGEQGARKGRPRGAGPRSGSAAAVGSAVPMGAGPWQRGSLAGTRAGRLAGEAATGPQSSARSDRWASGTAAGPCPRLPPAAPAWPLVLAAAGWEPPLRPSAAA